MPFEKAEKLKKEYTDKFVVVADAVPELRRFAGLTGIVKTVNMSGRALVEFAGTADISWYDIDPAYLKVVDAPVAKKADTKQPAAQTAVKPAEKKPASAQKKAASPLELARQQGAGTSGGTSQSSPTAAKPKTEKKKLSPLELARQQDTTSGDSGKPEPKAKPAASETAESAPVVSKSTDDGNLSPLELARQQDAGAAEKAPQSAAVSESKPKASAPSAADDKKLSPLELARQQDAGTTDQPQETSPKPDEVPASEPEASKAEEPAAPEPKSTSDANDIPTTGPDGQALSILELARLQGPFKG